MSMELERELQGKAGVKTSLERHSSVEVWTGFGIRSIRNSAERLSQSRATSHEPSIYWLVFEAERNHGFSDIPAVVHIAHAHTAQCICTVQENSKHVPVIDRPIIENRCISYLFLDSIRLTDSSHSYHTVNLNFA
jgi:hypothetical protein